jgi:hypothetical protein
MTVLSFSRTWSIPTIASKNQDTIFKDKSEMEKNSNFFEKSSKSLDFEVKSPKDS